MPLMEAGAVRRRSGRVKVRPRCIVGDKGYTSGAIRQWLRRRRIKAVIPQLSSERTRRRFDTALYRERNVVERLMNRLKRWRRVATRYEKRAVNYEAMVTLAAIMEYLP
jgi:transposase